jgi:hypothetical protein
LLGSKDSLTALSKVRTGTGLQTYRISKMVKRINEELLHLEEARMAIFRKFGEEKDGQISVKPENTQEFQKEMMDYFNQEIEINFDPVEITVDKYPSELSANEYLILEEGGFITVKEKDAK